MAKKLNSIPMQKKEDMIGGRCRWDVESDLRALRSASKIQNDKSKLKAIKLLIKEEMGALEKIAGTNVEGLGSEK